MSVTTSDAYLTHRLARFADPHLRVVFFSQIWHLDVCHIIFAAPVAFAVSSKRLRASARWLLNSTGRYLDRTIASCARKNGKPPRVMRLQS